MNIADIITHFPITIGLIAANVIFTLIGFSNPGMVDKTIMWPYRVARENQYYRMITSGFLHADFMHLFFNMFTLFYFGINVEFIFTHDMLGGNVAYLALYFLGLIISDLPSYIKHRNNSQYRSLGASGAVSAVVFAGIVFQPWGTIRLYGAIRLSAALYAVLYIIYCIYAGKKGNDNINHDAHLWGALFGLAFTIILIASMQPQLFNDILVQLQHPSIFGNDPGNE